VRGLRPEAAKLWAAGGGEEAVVRWLREGSRGGGGCSEQEVRGLSGEAIKLLAAGGWEEAAVVLWLRSEGGDLRVEAQAGGRLAAEEAEGDRPPSDHFRTLNLCPNLQISPGDRKSL
jgi:hypothetical protein